MINYEAIAIDNSKRLWLRLLQINEELTPPHLIKSCKVSSKTFKSILLRFVVVFVVDELLEIRIHNTSNDLAKDGFDSD